MADPKLTAAIERFLSRSVPVDIADAEAHRRRSDDLLIARAARSWAALEWKRGNAQAFPEWPDVPRWYLSVQGKHLPVQRRYEVSPVRCWAGGAVDWWLSGSLPEVPDVPEREE